MKIIIQVYLLVLFSIVWSEAASNKNSTDSSSQSVSPKPKHAPPPPPPQIAPPPIPQSQQSQSSVDFSSKAIPPHPLRTKGHLPIRNAQQKYAQSQYSKSQHSDNSNSKNIPEQPQRAAPQPPQIEVGTSSKYLDAPLHPQHATPQPSRVQAWISSQAALSQHSQSSQSQRPLNVHENNEQQPTTPFLVYPESIDPTKKSFSFASVDPSQFGSEPQNFSYYGPSSPLTPSKIINWFFKLTDEQWDIQSALIKMNKIGRAPEFQPFLNIIKYSDSIGPNETVISSVFPAELRAKFNDLNEFDKNYITKYQNEIDFLLRENQSPLIANYIWYEYYDGLLGLMMRAFRAKLSINVEFEKIIDDRLSDICGQRHSEIVYAITEIQLDKIDIENSIEQMNELIKRCEDKFKIACDTIDKKRTARMADFHTSLNVLATEKVLFLQKITAIHEKVLKLIYVLDAADNKRYAIYNQMISYFNNIL